MIISCRFPSAFVSSLLLLSSSAINAVEYGVDCSFPIHHEQFQCPAGVQDRHEFYEDFMQGCRDFYGRKAGACDTTERDRLNMSLKQPKAMINYTDTGFKKIRAPEDVMELIYRHWEANKHDKEQEAWSTGNVYVNHWKVPTHMVSVENTKLRGAGSGLKSKIWEAARTTIEEWTGMELRPTSMYGIRVYGEGAVLSPHVDRIPLISSAIVNVAQDLDEPWPLEVIDRYGNAVNVTMEPGDMVLYESHSLVHARPYPLKGRFYANIFIHFEPTGRPLHDQTDAYLDEMDEFLPPYLDPESDWAQQWAQQNPQGWKRPSPAGPKQQTTPNNPHVAAALGDLPRLERIAQTNQKSLHKRDGNGWQSVHEAARSGHKDVVEFLIKNGADKNARTGWGANGQSPLNLALGFHSRDSPIVQYLLSLGAEDIPADEL